MATTKRTPAKAKPRTTKPRVTKPATPDLEAGKAVAQAHAADPEPTVEQNRERRAELIEELNKADKTETEKEIKAQKAAGQGAKIDDAGAIEQARVARESHAEQINELQSLEGPPTVAPVIEKGPSIKLYSRRDEDLGDDPFGKKVTDARFVGNKLWLVGEDAPFPGEVIIDIRRTDGQDHQRFSTWTERDTWEANLPGLSGIGDWLIHVEYPITQVGEGRDDHLPRILETEPITLSLR